MDIRLARLRKLSEATFLSGVKAGDCGGDGAKADGEVDGVHGLCEIGGEYASGVNEGAAGMYGVGVGCGCTG